MATDSARIPANAASPDCVSLEAALAAEWEVVKRQRSTQADARWFQDEANRFGIALSGGGIRAATLSLGFLEVLNETGLLARADYLSTVSGGGYLGGFVTKQLWSDTDYTTLFGGTGSSPTTLNALERWLLEHAKYLAPGRRLRGAFNVSRLGAALIASDLLNWSWLVLVAALGWLVAGLAWSPLLGVAAWLRRFVPWGIGLVLVWHLTFHPLRHLRLWSSGLANWIETVLLWLALLTISTLTIRPGAAEQFRLLLGCIGALIAIGFFVSPNLLTMHRFYRDRLAEAFMRAPGMRAGFVALHRLFDNTEGTPHRPYPLINTCLNLMGEQDSQITGAATSDYFLLSPRYCGSRLTGYAAADAPGYRGLTLETAVACSGAAVNPELGIYGSRAVATLMGLLNLRLGYWILHPRTAARRWLWRVPWWPYYQMLEVRGRTDSTRRFLNISDGGHIENLGVYELLRRHCRLIVCLDSGADPRHRFADLQNLVIRARQELGCAIEFRQQPEELIRPAPSTGFSHSHFVIADVHGAQFSGLLVYVKASLRAPSLTKLREGVGSTSFQYKTFHPAFPHESTLNQFFDDSQWKAYYRLGRFMAGDLLRADATRAVAVAWNVGDLHETLSSLVDVAALRDYIRPVW